MLAKSLHGIRTNSQAKSGTEPATKWGCHTDTPTTTTAEITPEQTGRSSLLFIGGSIVPRKSAFEQLRVEHVAGPGELAANPVFKRSSRPEQCPTQIGKG